jgi:ATP-binding cassette subfamily F protein 3
LDLETKNIVEDVFESYEGPIIFISHDRYFINRVATKIMRLDKSGTTIFEGNYDEFKASLVPKIETKPLKQPREKLQSAAFEIKKLEKEIDGFHREIETLKCIPMPPCTRVSVKRLQHAKRLAIFCLKESLGCRGIKSIVVSF